MIEKFKNPDSLFLFPYSTTKKRVDACNFCKRIDGNLVGLVDYIGIYDADMIQCPSCGLISIDHKYFYNDRKIQKPR
jgi:hypothetical protein